jgi:hypothetical protein
MEWDFLDWCESSTQKCDGESTLITRLRMRNSGLAILINLNNFTNWPYIGHNKIYGRISRENDTLPMDILSKVKTQARI